MSLLEALKRDRLTFTVVGVLVLVAVVFVAGSLNRPEVISYAPTTPAPAEVGDTLIGPVLVTVNATGERWRFFDFSRGSVVENPPPDGWDLAFERFRIVVNGGPGFGGRGGALVLPDTSLASVSAVPASGYVESVARSDSTNAAFDHWYDYSWTSHLLTPKPAVYAVRTADGRYAKIRIMSYYCEGAVPGCLTFRYVYQGGGGTDVSPR